MKRCGRAVGASLLALAMTWSAPAASKPKPASRPRAAGLVRKPHPPLPPPRPLARFAVPAAKAAPRVAPLVRGRELAATRSAPARHDAARRTGRPRPVAVAAVSGKKKVVSKRVAHRAAAAAQAAPLPLIMIDPGHGGADCGAVGVTGLLEKDVTLAAALELRRELLAGKRFRVHLTRSGDRSVSLASRVGRAWAERPALFISLHADASPDRRAHGASVYVRANATAAGPVTKVPASTAGFGRLGLAESPGPSPASALLQDAMVEQLKDDVAMVSEPARRAHLYVLGAVDVPGVLVEMGFVSNPREERLLRSPRHRRTMVRAIKDAIGDYFGQTALKMAAR